MLETTSTKPISFACPKCKRPLSLTKNALQCNECNRIYPIAGDIPDFISDNLQSRIDQSNFFDILAHIYESWLWQSFFLSLNSAGRSSMQSIAHFISETLEGVTGNVLDVACGPATYGRRIASPSRSDYGIDISMGMLRQGMAYVRRDGVPGVHLARARVEELPFENSVFDGAICGGSLHLFPDTALALREMARTLKAGAPLAVTTFVVGNSFAARLVQQGKNKKMHAFKLPELQHYLTESGFEGFASKQDGTFMTFSTHRAGGRV